MSDKKPVIFISYSHKDEPDKPAEGEVQWLSFVRTYLQPAVKHGVVALFDDQRLTGGEGLDPEIEKKLHTCDVFLLLISAYSLASNYIVDTEIRITRERQSKGEDVHFYPLLLTPTPKIALDKLKDMVIRPKDATPLSAFSYGERVQQMTDAADEIAAIAAGITSRKPPTPKLPSQPAFVHIASLPETAYESLVGRETELKRLDAAWANRNTNILSLIAEGGAGKSALLNEWLIRLQADNYRDAETVLGWSFYSQGTKERATSAEQFLNWAIEKLGVKIETTSATAKGEAIAEEMMKRRVLILLDGCEPLQHGLDKQQGELKDQGLRALLRRFASTPPAQAHGLVVLTSRLSIKDIAHWENSAAPVVNVEQLSDEAGAALLRDNGVWGTDKELQMAARDFEGHPLALGLLASLLKETQLGDVRRRDHIRAWTDDEDNARHDHARRVMEPYEREWLAGQPVLLAIMHVIGLFDRPASGDCLEALRSQPKIKGLTDRIVRLDDREWQRAVARLREVRLLAPADSAALDVLDAHPLVREWFGSRFRQSDEAAWKAAHSRLCEHLRRMTREGERPTLESLAPLYQAVTHGCLAGRHQEVLKTIYVRRICRHEPDGEIMFYSKRKLGAYGSDLAAIAWFFTKPYEIPVSTLADTAQTWVLAEAARSLSALGRISEALTALRSGLSTIEARKDWNNAARRAINISEVELLVGEVDGSLASAAEAVKHADRTGDDFLKMISRALHAGVFHVAGRAMEAEALFADAEQWQEKLQPSFPLLYSFHGYRYCEMLLAQSKWVSVCDRCITIGKWEAVSPSPSLVDRGLRRLSLGCAYFGMALTGMIGTSKAPGVLDDAFNASNHLDEATDGLRAAGQAKDVLSALLARAAFRRSLGDWDDAARDLDEIEEVAYSGPMKLYLCDLALGRARLAFAKIEVFEPLNGLMEDSPPKLVAPDAVEAARLKTDAAKQLAVAADYIKTCGYHKRDEELAELLAVLRGEKRFADLPPRV
jgi:tetratricopeptide (TPR) repeat protein